MKVFYLYLPTKEECKKFGWRYYPSAYVLVHRAEHNAEYYYWMNFELQSQAIAYLTSSSSWIDACLVQKYPKTSKDSNLAFQNPIFILNSENYPELFL